jgi:hypothetical protein
MAGEMKRGASASRDRCIYCGADKDLTDDHVPPKLLLMRPYPENLITVPACEICNQSFQKDDEYMRTMLAIDVRASKNAAARVDNAATGGTFTIPKIDNDLSALAAFAHDCH